MRATTIAAAALLAPLAALAGDVRVQARESIVLSFPGALTAFAVDPSTVEPSLQAGELTLHGRRAGTTLVTIVKPDGTETLQVQVDPAPLPAQVTTGIGLRSSGNWEMHYDSASGRVASSLTLPFVDGDRSLLLRLDALHDPRGSDVPAFALPWASVTLQTPRSSLVLLDALVDESPLTLDGRVLRGLHWRQDGVELHAGIASSSPLQDALVPRSGARALGLSWRVPVAGLTLVPRLLSLPDSRTPVPAVAALGLEDHGENGSYRAEVGWSARPGASFEIESHGPRGQGWARASYRPAGFAALSSATAAGTAAEAAWTQAAGPQTTLALSVSASQLQLASGSPRAARALAELRQSLSPSFTGTVAAGVASYRGTSGESVRQQTLALGLAYGQPAGGAAATVRRQGPGAGAPQGGFGARLSAHAVEGHWRASSFFDVQQQAATMELLLQGRPDLRRALAELGIRLDDPDEVMRALREHADLLQARGITTGPLQVQPLRWQAGGQIAWEGGGATRPQVGLRVNAERLDTPTGRHASLFATLYASWRLRPDTDLTASYTRWREQRTGLPATGESSWQVGVRTALNGQPFPGVGTHAISGHVAREGTGAEAGSDQPLAGVEVVLDRSRRTVTDSRGRFEFDRPGAGDHRLEAMLPALPGAAFTTPSIVTVAAGSGTRFGVAVLPVQLSGVVRNDAGMPIAGVRVRIEAAGLPRSTVTTDSSGAYRVAAAEGPVRVTLDPDSLPPGYELRALAPRTRQLSRDHAAAVHFTVAAQRSVQGEITGDSAAGALVSIQEARRAVRADAAGRFVLRGLPSGRLTLVVATARGERVQDLELPDGPAALRGVKAAAP